LKALVGGQLDLHHHHVVGALLRFSTRHGRVFTDAPRGADFRLRWSGLTGLGATEQRGPGSFLVLRRVNAHHSQAGRQHLPLQHHRHTGSRRRKAFAQGAPRMPRHPER
jgi:hypothetical protein